MELLKIITLIVQMGMPLTFPQGDESLQQPLADKIEVICKDEKYPEASKLHEIKNSTKFKKKQNNQYLQKKTQRIFIYS